MIAESLTPEGTWLPILMLLQNYQVLLNFFPTIFLLLLFLISTLLLFQLSHLLLFFMSLLSLRVRIWIAKTVFREMVVPELFVEMVRGNLINRRETSTNWLIV